MEYDNEIYIDDRKECNELAIKFVLDNTRQLQDGRLEMLYIWNDKVAYLLGRNYNLSRSVLRTNLKRLLQNEEHLFMYDESSGVIERIDIKELKTLIYDRLYMDNGAYSTNSA